MPTAVRGFDRAELSSELVVERVNVDLSVLEELPEIPVVLRLSIDDRSLSNGASPPRRTIIRISVGQSDKSSSPGDLVDVGVSSQPDPVRQQLNRDTTGERHHTSPIPDNRSNPLQVRSFLTRKALPLFGGQCQLINVNDPG